MDKLGTNAVTDSRSGLIDGQFRYRGKTAREWLPEVVSTIVDRFDPLTIVLFGSHGRGDPAPDSDLDLLVVFPKVENKRARSVEILAALAALPAPVDVITTDLDEISRRAHLVGTVLYPALNEGRTVYERSA